MSAPELKTQTQANVWQQALEIKTFTVAELTVAAGQPVATVRHLVTGWCRDGYLSEAGRQDTQGPSATRYEVSETVPRPFGPKDKRIWQAMRHNPKFSAFDIAVFASIPEDMVTADEVQRYIRTLLDAGYVRQTTKRKKGKTPARYHLIRNTGPNPPVTKRITTLWDPNTGDLMPTQSSRTGLLV